MKQKSERGFLVLSSKIGMSLILKLSRMGLNLHLKLTQFDVLVMLVIFFSIFLGCSGQKENVKADWEKKSDSVFTSLASTPNLQEGYKVYKKYGCILCHGVNGEKGSHNRNAQTGEEIPALTYVAEGYTLDELKQQILKGVENIARKDSLGLTPPYRMPSWKGIMTEEELEVLTEYLMSLKPKGEKEEW
ncbi:MAG: hypothetical protein RBG1_1C00001G0850 [candidate division Zixibacteria bacterium RBG-1]|nr:MAG: hypothetical protein RBG1_1C00001G0850 [candidate division Zixibacteria bacterium RBG-1]OGC85238.1 MAG: hypothetical protein A2V73_00840 [candidate division Zixibacteria bacterium RBG_19FT_COMBO_42_43]